ncbi:MAG: DUF6164 family protein [Pseudomonadota bacterium]
MAKLLLNLRHVPQDESDAVLAMLEQHSIEHYQLPPSAFMISAGSIWIQHDQEYDRAKRLFDSFQAERATQARSEWQHQQDHGTQPSWFDELRQRPGQWIGYVLIAVLILLFMLTPVIQLFR